MKAFRIWFRSREYDMKYKLSVSSNSDNDTECHPTWNSIQYERFKEHQLCAINDTGSTQCSMFSFEG
jgi:hypothetical protein